MNCKAASLILAAGLCFCINAEAQSIFGFPEMIQQSSQSRRVSFDYDVEFLYSLDFRDFGPSKDILASSMVVNNARLTPSAGLSIQQDRFTKHRLMMGVNVSKDMGDNPADVRYVESEGKETLENLALFGKVLIYYDLRRNSGNSIFEAKAGIFPNSARSGYYSRALFSDLDRIYNSEIEGAILKFENRKFRSELGLDCTSSVGLERVQGYNIFTSGEYQPFKWGSIGWDASCSSVRPSPIEDASADNIMFNPYLKFDFGHFLKMDELSLRGGALMSYQMDRFGDGNARMPMGAEAVFSVRNWGIGIEDTFFYGDNMMPFKSSAYASVYDTKLYADLIYRGESQYFTKRGYASFYNRLELSYSPEISEFLSVKASAVGHIINGTETVNPFIGWQAKLSAYFNLDAFRNPGKGLYGQTARKKGRTGARHQGPSFVL